MTESVPKLKFACEKKEPMVGWTFRKGVALLRLADSGGAVFTASRKDSHGMIPSGIIYRLGIQDSYTLGRHATSGLRCGR